MKPELSPAAVVEEVEAGTRNAFDSPIIPAKSTASWPSIKANILARKMRFTSHHRYV